MIDSPEITNRKWRQQKKEENIFSEQMPMSNGGTSDVAEVINIFLIDILVLLNMIMIFHQSKINMIDIVC